MEEGLVKYRAGKVSNNCKIDILVLDTGGGRTATVTSSAWKIIHTYDQKVKLQGYQSNNKLTVCKVVNAATKAEIIGREEPIIVRMNYATYLDNTNKRQSLYQPFQLMAHGIKCDLTPSKYDGKAGMTIEEDFIPFNYDDEKLFLHISKPIEKVKEERKARRPVITEEEKKAYILKQQKSLFS